MSDTPIKKNDLHKFPRLYIDAGFAPGLSVDLETGQVHYLRNVLRKQEGDFVRVFNGRDGEWLARISALGKKKGACVLEECLRDQLSDEAKRRVHLYFSPIKKQRMDMLIEKAVELGATDLHPVIMRRSVMRKVNEDRVRAQIIEAAEQCERLDLARLHSARGLDEALLGLEAPLYACVERHEDTKALRECDMSGDAAFLIGPEGGFDENEIVQIRACVKAIPVSLGDNILRAETAAMVCLAWAVFYEY